MPVYRGRIYPDNWLTEIRPAILERAQGVCEWCGAVNYEAHPETGSRVVLTIAHLGTSHANGRAGDKHDKFDVRPENLAALCQRCHLAYDLDDHIANARRTRARKRRQAAKEELPFYREKRA